MIKQHQGFIGAQIEFKENKQVTVDGCKKILEYEPETIKLSLGCYNIRLNGKNLTLKKLTDRTVLIDGIFDSLEFCV